MQTTDKENLIRKNNMKIFPWYKMFSWDLLFFYAISFLFLTDIKGLTPAQVILTDAFYPFFKFVLQPISSIIISKVGKRNSLIFANSLINVYLVLIIFANGFENVVFATFFCSFGYVIKNMCEANFLYESVPHCKKRGEIFSKLDGKGFAYFYLFDGITSFFTGFSYVINPYLPIIISIILNSIAIFLSTQLQEIPKDNTESLKSKDNRSMLQVLKEFIRNFRYGFRYVHKSPRLRSLIMVYSIFYGILVLTLPLRRSLLKEMSVSAENFGIIFAVLGVIAAISANRQNLIHKLFRNRTISVLTIPYCISCIVIGLLPFFNLNYSFWIVMIAFALQFIIRGPFYTLIKRYMNNFSTSKARDKIYSVATFFESLSAFLVTALGSLIVEWSNSSYAFLIIGILSTIIILIVLSYMKTRVGLKPEEYKKSEIEMLNLK